MVTSGSRPAEKLVSQPLKPVFESGGQDTPVVVGEPVLPGAFVWRGEEYPVVKVLSSGKGLGPCTHGSGERYVTKHWYRLETRDNLVMRIYFERRPRSGGSKRQRWWLYSIESGE